ncbi:MAG TPA: cyclic-di-AMP receptor [Candidatus Limnocylindria bacterium]|nr:cyclic-di-AMP receptor [Candidatus Limnocylindria bacterium]
MSQLLIAIVREQDAEGALEALVAEGHRVTGFRTFGGFLRENNRTLMVAVDDANSQGVIDIFERTCHGGEVEVPLVLMDRLKDWQAATVVHAGATIFVVSLADVIRV